MSAYDAKWQKRKRKIDTEFIVLFLFEFVSGALGDSFRMLLQDLLRTAPLSWKEKSADSPTLAASSVCEARQKFNEEIFVLLNYKILNFLANLASEDKTVLKGKRVFEVDARWCK